MKINLKNILLFILLLTAFVFRIYRIGQLLDFNYDQGRDALVIWDLIHKGKFFLIGPTTGIEGVFRGPWYYWLITPFYLFGRGNPVFPAVFLVLTTVVASWMTYVLGKKIGGEKTGFTALIISCFSTGLILSSRWLSNPTPMFLISTALVWSLYRYSVGNKWVLVLTGLLMGLAMQFGSAGEIFYFPAIIIYFCLSLKKWPSIPVLMASLQAVCIPFVPQLIFDFRHQGILTKGLINFVFGSMGTHFSFGEIVKLRLALYWDVFSQNLWLKNQILLIPFVGIALYSLILNFKALWKNEVFKIVFIFTLCPLLGLLFFRGNGGTVYGYYLTGYYLIFILLFSAALSGLSKYRLGRMALVLFLMILIVVNSASLKEYLTKSQDAVDAINLGNQLQALAWINSSAADTNYNVDVYVPPVIPYAYDYLFQWRFDNNLVTDQVPLLYTLYEIDPPHPERLDVWLTRQKGIGKVESTVTFGGITVQKRLRIK